MAQALYFKPSFERLQSGIEKAAPDLDIVLIDDQGELTRQGKPVSRDEISPDYFWIHSELFFSPVLKDYFQLVADFPNPRWLHTINTGLDKGPYLELLKSGVTITNNHSQAIAIAEYVMAHVLSCFQDHADYRDRQRQVIWKYRPFREIYHSHWVIIGFGHIGQQIARRAKAFGVHITAVRRSTDDEGLADQVCTMDNMGGALNKADVVVLACASNDHTRDLADAQFFAQLKKSPVLVNIARGDLVVEEDMKQALDDGALGQAILDVFRQEPPVADSWVWHHPKVTLTPHSSNAGSGMRQRSDDLFIENLNRMESGQLLLNVVEEKDIL